MECVLQHRHAYFCEIAIVDRGFLKSSKNFDAILRTMNRRLTFSNPFAWGAPHHVYITSFRAR